VLYEDHTNCCIEPFVQHSVQTKFCVAHRQCDNSCRGALAKAVNLKVYSHKKFLTSLLMSSSSVRVTHQNTHRMRPHHTAVYWRMSKHKLILFNTSNSTHRTFKYKLIFVVKELWNWWSPTLLYSAQNAEFSTLLHQFSILLSQLF